jgi:cholesterol transport system auxiliary component
MSRRVPAIAAAILAAASLGGCVSLLPKTTPSRLYRFGVEAPASQQAPDARGVGLEPIGFPREAMGDGILTVQGAETSYIGGARWVGPASVLFRQALEQAFDTAAPGVHLRGRGEPGKLAASLGLEVVRFEADYPNAKGAPVVRITLRARLSTVDARPILAETFDVAEPATDNRVTAIVAAYNRAATKALTSLAEWVDQNAPGAAPSRPTR